MKHSSVCLSASSLVAVCFPVFAHAAIITTAINPANGHTYHLITAASWSASETEAVSLSGHLATINNAAENAWVESTFKSFGSSFWLGYSDAATEGTWLWANGEPTTYTNWGGIEPNDFCPAAGGEDSAIMITNGFGVPSGIADAHWVDIPGNLVCNVPNAPVPLGLVEVATPTDVDTTPSLSALAVRNNYPNPFASSTVLSIGLSESSEAEITVYDVTGRRVASEHVALAAGWNNVAFDARDETGHPLASGIYLYRVSANGHATTRKMLVAH